MGASFGTLDPRKLVYFAAIVEQGSLKGAARALELSQPALSTSMDRLEAELGQQLLDRGPKGVTPTFKGNLLYTYARLIRHEIQMATEAMSDRPRDESDPLRIGSLPSLASSIMPMALGRWQSLNTDRRIEVAEHAQIDLLLGLLRHEFDFVFGFTECYELEDGLRQRVLFRDRLCVIARPDHPLASEPRLTWEMIAAYPWIYPTLRRPHTILENALRAAEVPMPRQVTVCGSVSIMKSLVAGSDHLSMQPNHAVRAELVEGRLISLPIEDPQLDRNIAVYFREGTRIDDCGRQLIDAVETVGLESCRRER